MFWAHNLWYADVKWDFFFSSHCTDRNLFKRNPHPIKINRGNNIHAANLWWRMILIIGQPLKACRLHRLLSGFSLTLCWRPAFLAFRQQAKLWVNFQVNYPSKDSLFFSIAPIIALPHLNVFRANPPVCVLFSSTAATSTWKKTYIQRFCFQVLWCDCEWRLIEFKSHKFLFKRLDE